MRHVVEAGTDAASVVLFDPGAMPEDFDTRDDPADVLAELTAAGRAYGMETGADGAYLLHAYVDESVPARLEAYATDPIVVEHFAVPTGTLYFAGTEYAFRNDDAFLRKHPHMGGSFAVRPGVYRLTLFRTEYPDGLQEGLLRDQVSPWAFRLHQGMGCLVGLAVAAFLGSLALLFQTARDSWLRYLLLPLGILVAAPFAVARLGAYRTAQQRWREIEREFPSVVACLEFRDGV